MRAFAWLRSLLRDNRGNALVIGAATLPLVIGAAAIGVDTIHLSVSKRQLQRAADSAAIAGARARAQSMPVNTAVNYDLGLNNDVALNGAPTIQNAPAVGAFTADQNAVRVVLTAQRSVPFISFFTSAQMNITVEATATRVNQGQYCVVSLESGNTTGIVFTGNANVNLGCGVVTNSTSGSAISAGGSATVTATPVAAVGTVPASNRYTPGTQIISNTGTQADPYAALPEPAVPANCQTSAYSVGPNETAVAPVASSAGVYCYAGMDIKGTVSLPSGIYIVNGGELSFGAQANVTCTGCTFILTSDNAVSDPSSVADLNINGGANLNLTAMSTGNFAGVLMYQDRRAAYGTTTVNGGANMTMLGGLYFPSRELQFNGNAGIAAQCLQLVALRLDFRGNSGITNNCPANSGASAFNSWVVRLVG